MALSKLEIQQMLREMNVKFGADETYAALRQRLQEENHSLWLKSVSADQSADGAGKRSVVRKRRKSDTEADEAADEGGRAPQKGTQADGYRQRSYDRERENSAHRPQAIQKPSPGQPWKAAADGTEPFNRTRNVFQSVLKRAKNRCERCGIQSGEEDAAAELQPYYIQPISQGGQHSVKNTVALCAACMAVLSTDLSSREAKELKRKTRSRMYDALTVTTKKRTVRNRRPPTG